jgi:hypothetical protein
MTIKKLPPPTPIPPPTMYQLEVTFKELYSIKRALLSRIDDLKARGYSDTYYVLETEDLISTLRHYA